jgi:hypothetical protein
MPRTRSADRLHAAALRDLLLHFVNVDAERQVDLRAGETDAFVRVHRLDHVVDQRTELPRFDVCDFDVARLLAEHRMSEPRHFEDRHRHVSIASGIRRIASAISSAVNVSSAPT